MRAQQPAEGVHASGDGLGGGGTQPAVRQEPTEVGLDRGQHEKVADGVEELSHGWIGAALDRRGERPEDDEVHVRACGVLHVVLSAVRHGEGVCARCPQPAQAVGEAGEAVLLAVLQQCELPPAVEQIGVAAPPGDQVPGPSGDRPDSGVLGNHVHDPPSEQTRHADAIERGHLLPVAGQHGLRHQLHEDGVVTLERRHDVGVRPQGRQPALREITPTTAGLACVLDGGDGMPGGGGLDPRGIGLQAALGLLVGDPARLHVVEKRDELLLGEAQRVGASQRWQQLPLVTQVVQQGDLLTGSRRDELPTGVAVA